MGRRLNDTEELLWALGHHPHLASTMGAIIELEGSPDPLVVRQTVAKAVAAVPGLHEHVLDTGVALTAPTWHVDTNLDLDHHLRFIDLGHSTSEADDSTESLDLLANQIIHDPFDRSRPLWQLTVVSGLANGRSAVIVKLHHAIADGQGALQLATELIQFAPEPHTLEPGIDAKLHEALQTLAAGQPPLPRGLGDTIKVGAEQFVSNISGAAELLNDPSSLINNGSAAVAQARVLAGNSHPTIAEPSPRWSNRSRNRRTHRVIAPLLPLQDAARSRGASLNDAFLSVVADAAVRNHRRHGHPITSVAASTVISTRTDETGAAANAAIPTPVTIPGEGADIAERVAAIQSQMSPKRSAATVTPDLLASLSAVMGLVPSSIRAAVVLDRTSKIDIATSNLPGPPVPVWFCGQAIETIVPLGPVLGTAMNITLLTCSAPNGPHAAFGLTVDPVALPDHLDFVDDFRQALVDFVDPTSPTPGEQTG